MSAASQFVIPERKSVSVTLPATKQGPAILDVSVEVSPSTGKLDHFSACLWSRGKRTMLAFALDWNQSTRIAERDRHWAARLWVDHASFQISDAEVKQLLETFGPYGMSLEARS